MNNRSNKFIPLIISLSLIAGLLLGSFYANHFNGNHLSIINASSNKINDLLHIIDDQYVDKVELGDLVEKAMPSILSELDPHSSYISAKDVENEMQDIKGSFSGIGVVFTIYDDTARIVRVIKGGPSEEVGLQAGDRIISVDGKNFTGPHITNDSAMSHLKGPKNSKVVLGIHRKGSGRVYKYTIERGDVPVKSIQAAYMLDHQTGYIRIGNFGDTTYPELLAALAQLNQEGFRSLVIDLRGNRGGLMAPAIRMANEFLPKDRLIVYTQGRKSPRSEYSSDGRGSYQHIPLVVLVDEISASSSEIFTAAIQDNDRGSIIGRRTFGKGLVQEPIQFPDGSMLRLTIARYYSASGRCLQKPYLRGQDNDYQMDLIRRAEKGEYIYQDSIHLKGKKYHTRLGRIVYSEGGIMPDYFIPEDTTGITSYFIQAYNQGWMSRYAFIFIDEHREKLDKMADWEEMVQYLSRQHLPQKFADYAAGKGVKKRPNLLHKSYQYIQSTLISLILDDYYGEAQRLMFMNQKDPNITKALELFKEGKAFPQAPKEQQK